MKKTTSIAPLVLGIIAGVLGIIGGSCLAICGDFMNDVAAELETDVSLITDGVIIGGWIVIASSILGLVASCIAKTANCGPLLIMIAFAAEVVGIIFCFSIINVISAILFLIAGIIALVKHEQPTI